MNDTMYKNVALLILFGFMLYNCGFAANKGTNSLKHDKEVCQNESMNDSKLYKKYQYFSLNISYFFQKLINQYLHKYQVS